MHTIHHLGPLIHIVRGSYYMNKNNNNNNNKILFDSQAICTLHIFENMHFGLICLLIRNTAVISSMSTPPRLQTLSHIGEENFGLHWLILSFCLPVPTVIVSHLKIVNNLTVIPFKSSITKLASAQNARHTHAQCTLHIDVGK